MCAFVYVSECVCKGNDLQCRHKVFNKVNTSSNEYFLRKKNWVIKHEK